jgi:nitrate reductase delta subunit
MTQDQQRPSEAQVILPTGSVQDAAGVRVHAGQFRHVVLKASVRLLGYPDDAFWLVLPQVEASLRALPETPPVVALIQAITTIREYEPTALAALYVATFDFSEPTALYLTAHELGDSRQRGMALLTLRSLLRAAGFEPASTELPDYLPMLLEFLASAAAEDDTGDLEHRLATVCRQIHSKLADEHPYKGMFAALPGVLSAEGSPGPQEQLAGREKADTDELPYPLHSDKTARGVLLSLW